MLSSVVSAWHAALRRMLSQCVVLTFLASALTVGTAPRPATAAPINWDVALDTPFLSGAAGETLVFTAMISNDTGAELLLDLGTIVFEPVPSAPFVAQFADEFLLTLGIIPISGYSGPLFFIQWGAGVLPGTTGTGRVELSAFAPASPLSLAPDFSAAVAGAGAVPEPATITLIAIGLLAVARDRRRRRMP